MTITTRLGHTFQVGGRGGGNYRAIDVPEHLRIIGFYGGTGGHLHNLGVILSTDPDCDTNSYIYTHNDISMDMLYQPKPKFQCQSQHQRQSKIIKLKCY